MTVFGAEDVDGTVARATELGGRVMMPARDIEGVGRFAVFNDPQGVLFGIVTGHVAARRSVRHSARVPGLIL